MGDSTVFPCDGVALHGGGGAWQHAQGGDTALILVSRLGRLDCARLLLNAGADKDAKNNVRVDLCDCSETYWLV